VYVGARGSRIEEGEIKPDIQLVKLRDGAESHDGKEI
jgi:hypothetical protein